jgi:tetrathionate reductase subunit C
MSPVTEIVQPVWPVAWSLAIPQYFFMTGVSAAAFLVSSLTYGFGDRRFKPIAGLALIVALTVLLVAPLNLVADLGQPGRFYELTYALHATAPMSWGVYLLTTYPALILAELLLAFRAPLVERANASSGLRAKVYRLLAFGRTSTTASERARLHGISRRLALLGIPWALAVHGYTGYILGVMKARPLWHTALMPVIFLVSAMVSGIAFMILVTAVFQRFETARRRVDPALMDLLAKLLAGFIVVDLLLRLFWYSIQWLYGHAEYGPVTEHLFVGSFWSAVVVETVLGLGVPLAVALVPAWRRSWPLYAAAVLAVVGVWVFRWDTVIGGQLVPKVGAGFYAYAPPTWGADGIMQVVANWALWLFLFIGATWLLPWQREAGEGEPDSHRAS